MRQEADAAQQLTTEDVEAYFKSAWAQNCKDRLRSVSVTGEIATSVRQFTELRNHVLAVVSFENAHRAGVLINFMLADFSIAWSNLQKQTRQETITFNVHKHKTDSVYGLANIVLTTGDDLMMLKSYIKIRRSLRGTRQSVDNVFVNYTGEPMSASNVAYALTQTLAKAGINKSASCTKIRKLTATSVIESCPEHRSQVADHMLHSTSTQGKFYQ
jgi:hypothetical protein